MLKLDTQLLQPLVTQQSLAAQQDAVQAALKSLRAGACPGSDFLGWLDLPLQDHSAEHAEVKKAAAEIRENADLLIVVGIGGSYLGSRAAIDGLCPAIASRRTGPEILFLGHHLDADYSAELLAHLEGKRYYINVISKSGTTTEPGIAFRLLLDHLQRNCPAEQIRDRVIATTDPSDGALLGMARSAGYRRFIIPKNIGGRFSVLTPVGLLPMTAAGIDIDQMLEGARSMAQLCRENPDVMTNDALRYAAARHLLYQAGKQIEIMGVWNPALLCLAEWWKQLCGESEGKGGRGIFPASVGLTTDLHSLGQYIQDGRRTLFETFVLVDQNRSALPIPGLDGNPDELGFLAGMDMASANLQAWRGTALAHHNGGTPNMTLHLGKRDARHFGELFYFFQFAVAVSGLLLGVNPFDQPGVEAYKKNMFALLGKPGTEALAADLEQRLAALEKAE